MNNIRTQDKIAVVLLLGIILFLFYVLFLNSQNNHIRTDELKNKIVVVNPFEKIELSAKAAIVWDMKTKKIIYGQNIETILPLASLTKAMTALTAVELIPDYTVVTISKEYLAEEGDTGLLVDEKWKLKDLLAVSLLSSSNDGMRAVASVAGAFTSSKIYLQAPENSSNPNSINSEENLNPEALLREKFVNQMNIRAKTIGLTNTHFENENGLDKDLVQSGAYGTAHDVAILFDYILRNHAPLLEPTRYPTLSISSLTENHHELKNTNLIVNTIPGILGSKTGFTDLAGGNLAIITDIGLEGPYVISVLGSTIDGRFTDVETLLKATTEYVNTNK